MSDSTYVWTWEEWLYLATVLDLSSRRIVGWAMADHMRASLVVNASTMALEGRRPAPGLIFHSDRASQFNSGDFTALLDAHGIVQSFAQPGECWDCRRELVLDPQARVDPPPVLAHPGPGRRRSSSTSRSCHDRQRLHSSLGYLTSVEYEQQTLTIHHHTAPQAA